MSRPGVASLIPPPLARDARVVALLTAFEQALDDLTDRAIVMLDPAAVPESILPYLAVEHSLEEFIGSGLPTDVIRTLILRAWELHEPKGYVEGIVGGIGMLGYPASITQWWQEEPQAPRGTHRIDVPIDKPLWPGQPPASADTVRAVWRMIHAMQRWSQDHGIRLETEAPVDIGIGAGVLTAGILTISPYDPGPVAVDSRQRAGAGMLAGFVVSIDGWRDRPAPSALLIGGRAIAIHGRTITFGTRNSGETP